MGKCASKCCFCVSGLKGGPNGGRNKFEPPIQFTITATPLKNESQEGADLDFVPPVEEERKSLSSSEGLGDILFGREDSKSLEEISLSKEMDNRSREIMQSYQSSSHLDNYSKDETFTRPASSSEDSCLPESIPSSHPLPKEEDSGSIVSSESFARGCQHNLAFLPDEDFLIGSYHYKTEIIGEVKSVYSSEESSPTKVTTNLTLIDRCMGLELNQDDSVCEMSSIHFVLGEGSSLSSRESDEEDIFSLSMGKAECDNLEEVQTRL